MLTRIALSRAQEALVNLEPETSVRIGYIDGDGEFPVLNHVRHRAPRRLLKALPQGIHLEDRLVEGRCVHVGERRLIR